MILKNMPYIEYITIIVSFMDCKNKCLLKCLDVKRFLCLFKINRVLGNKRVLGTDDTNCASKSPANISGANRIIIQIQYDCLYK